MPTYKLPPKAYYDEGWLEQEKLKIFGGSWQFAGLESEFSEPGCYKAITVGFDELVVVRDKRENLNVFHNVCRHRGAQLVQGAGKCAGLVCPYHRWGYGLDGKLRGVPRQDQFDELEFENLGLHAASIAIWMGLVFVHRDEKPTRTLDEWLSGIKDELAVFDVSSLQLLKTDRITFDANWKLYVENHIDWLHLWYVHPETLGALTHDFGDVIQHGLHWTSYDPVKEKHRAAYQSANPLPNIPHLTEQPDRYLETGAHFVFPNLPIFTGSSFFALADLVPLSATKTQMNINVLGLPGGDVDNFLSQFNFITKGEDAAIVENIQKNVRSGRFAVGPIAHTFEKAISDFHDNYLKLMG